MLKPFSTGKLDAHEAKWKIMQDNSQKCCQIRKAHIHFICKQLGLEPTSINTKNFSSIQLAAENLRLTRFRALQFLERELQLLHDLSPHTLF